VRRFLTVIVLVGCVVGVVSCSKTKPVPSFTVTSSDFNDGQPLAAAQRKGSDLSPQLSWYGAPSNTQSYAVTIYDRDAHFWHWGVVNIPATTSALASGLPLKPPSMSELKNSAGRIGYVGAAPPAGSGVHHYEVTVYALDVQKLDVGAASSVPSAVSGHVLAKAVIVGTAEA
jgi:Raf kinase inhibitor-like YbhB/YbcL family protein